MKRLVQRIVLICLGKRNGQFVLLEEKSSGNVLVELYWQLTMGRKDTRFGAKHQNNLVIIHKINCTDVFMGTQI